MSIQFCAYVDEWVCPWLPPPEGVLMEECKGCLEKEGLGHLYHGEDRKPSPGALTISRALFEKLG